MRWSLAFWVVAAVFALGMAFSTVPTPLFPVYAERRGYGTATLTVIFAVYPVGVIASVFLLGHVSDWIGRRRALVPALGLEAASAVAFIASPALPVLLAARVVCGIGVGILTATATAYLSELDARARPGRPRRNDAVTAAASMGGFGVGALLSGAVAAAAPEPLRIPFAVFLVLLVVAMLAVARLPETLGAGRAETKGRYRVQRIAVPPHARRLFLAASGSGFAALSVLSLFTALAPILVTAAVPGSSTAVTGAVTCSARAAP